MRCQNHSIDSSRAIARYPLDDPIDLVVGRVTGTAEPDQALVGHSEALDDGRRVEVAVRGKDPSVGEPPADLLGRLAREREGERRRPGRSRRRPVEPDALDLAQSFPEPLKSAAPRSWSASNTACRRSRREPDEAPAAGLASEAR